MSLARFPKRTLRGDRPIHRIHRAATTGWWFSGDGTGRFDPVAAGRGACYFAEDPLGAWVEVFRRELLLHEVAVSERALLTVTVGRDMRLADVTSRRALQFGVTASLGADLNYSPSQTFAAEALEAGFVGVRYWVRRDPAQMLAGIALFGAAGSSDPPPRASGSSRPIPDELLALARTSFGYRVVVRP